MHYQLTLMPVEKFPGWKLRIEELQIPNDDEEAIRISEEIAKKMRFLMPNGKSCAARPTKLESWGDYEESPSPVKFWEESTLPATPQRAATN